MNEIKDLVEKSIVNNSFINLIITNYKGKENIEYNKVSIDPILIKDKINYHITFYFEKKVEHLNIVPDLICDKIIEILTLGFKQILFFTVENDYQILISKKNKIKIIEHKASKEKLELSHNRKKQYILDEDTPYDFLIRLNVMNNEGKVNKSRYNKFRQINRFLELVEDVINEIDKEEYINIIDFGCGKSYLTFALYHYLVNIKKLNVNIIGLDLKEDVIEFCNTVANDLNYTNLKFIHGDINNFENSNDIDMVITLHACDNATDAALVKAINWNAKVILSVPCCQKELRPKIDNEILRPMLKHGIIKEELSTLITDSLRAQVLELLGYNTQLVQFIGVEHTPKNILIRAIKSNKKTSIKTFDEYIEFKRFWNLDNIFIENELEKIGKTLYN